MIIKGLECVILVVFLWYPLQNVCSQGDEDHHLGSVFLEASSNVLHTAFTAQPSNRGDDSPSRKDSEGSAAEWWDGTAALPLADDTTQSSVLEISAPVHTSSEDGSIGIDRASEGPLGSLEADEPATSHQATARRGDATMTADASCNGRKTPLSDASRWSFEPCEVPPPPSSQPPCSSEVLPLSDSGLSSRRAEGGRATTTASARIEASLRSIPSTEGNPASSRMTDARFYSSRRATEPLPPLMSTPLRQQTTPSDEATDELTSARGTELSSEESVSPEDDGKSHGEIGMHADEKVVDFNGFPLQEPAFKDKKVNREDVLLIVHGNELSNEQMSQVQIVQPPLHQEMSVGVQHSFDESAPLAEHSTQDDMSPSQKPLLSEVLSVQEVTSLPECTPSVVKADQKDSAVVGTSLVAAQSVQKITPSVVQMEQQFASQEVLLEAKMLSLEQMMVTAEKDAEQDLQATRLDVEQALATPSPSAGIHAGDTLPASSLTSVAAVAVITDDHPGEHNESRLETVMQESESPSSSEPTEVLTPADGEEGGQLLKPEDIPSFDEWKKKVLEEEKEKQDQVMPAIPVLLPPVAKKSLNNYASVECGAKILSANPEAQSTSTILMENKDLYMLNPCSAKIWFVIELCEPVQVKQIDIGNLELFSSTPRDFVVSISDRYPIREWVKVGTLHARDERIIQSFPLHQQMYAMFLKMFTKYVKVELVSHHGSEHFCPISLIRVLGISMVEEYDEIDDVDETRRSGRASDELHDEDRDIAIGLGNPNENSSDNLLGSATSAILSMVNMAAKVLGGNKGDKEGPGVALRDQHAVRENASGEPETAVNGPDQAELPEVLKDKIAVVHDDRRRPGVTTLDDHTLTTERKKELTKLILPNKGPFSKTDKGQCGDYLAQSHRVTFLEVVLKKCPWHVPIDYTASVKYESLPVSSHLVLQMVESPTASNLPASESVATLAHESATVLLPSVVTADIKADASMPAADHISPAPSDAVIFSARPSTEEPLAADLRSSGVIFGNLIGDGAETGSISGDARHEEENASHVACTAIVGHASECDELFTVGVEPSVTTFMEAGARPDILLTHDGKEATSVVPSARAVDALEASATISDAEQPPDRDARSEEGKPSEGDARPPPAARSGEEARADAAQADVYPEASDLSPAPGGTLALGSAQKESVFMRLSNRIRALELNVSLSSRYLEEVSLRYRRQMEEMQKTFDKTIAKLLNSSRMAQEQVVQHEHLMGELLSRVENLTLGLVAVTQSVQQLKQEVTACHLYLLLTSEALGLLLLLALCLWFCKRAPDSVRAVESPLGDVASSFIPDTGMKNSSSNTEPSDVTSSSSQTVGVAVKSSPSGKKACGGATPDRSKRRNSALTTPGFALLPPPLRTATAAAAAPSSAAATAAAAIRFSDSESPSSTDEPDGPAARGSYFCGTRNVGTCGGLCGGGGGEKRPSRANARDRQGWPRHGRPERTEPCATIASERRSQLPARGGSFRNVAKANGGVAHE
ncbi:LOW QUALITY PROTEIN: SUN domain-containing ossification factor-like [Lethenteron reissneri]|uniref:LOW QUALITY PROTEIN: SUN domain-containing ossification factor-like n=1 Tax=Lethenteron reissneri TaxID=7753 RepID=UPI002AB63E20|nr:LOW QUALITY PROTEIN: SUN domain-containing ossification factor-like [Lethenteron reissneri]